MGCAPVLAGEFSWSTLARTSGNDAATVTRADMRCRGCAPNRIGSKPALSAPMTISTAMKATLPPETTGSVTLLNFVGGVGRQGDEPQPARW